MTQENPSRLEEQIRHLQSVRRIRQLISSDQLEHQEAAQQAFFQDTREGQKFLVRLNSAIVSQLIWSGFLPQDIHWNWEEICQSEPFCSAWDHVHDKILKLEPFRDLMRKYFSEPDRVQPWKFMMGHIKEYTLQDWARTYRETPHASISTDEHIEAVPDPVERDHSQTMEENPYPALGLLLDSLPLKQKAAQVLQLWPLDSFPTAWQEKYLPVVIETAAGNGRSEEEVKSRLESVLAEPGPEPADQQMAEQEEKRNRYFVFERFCEKRKLHLYRVICQDSGEIYSRLLLPSIESALKQRCEIAVQKDSEKEVKAIDENGVTLEQFSCEDGAKRQISNFSKYCYKQKYYRSKRINLNKKDSGRASGIMPTKKIAFIISETRNYCDTLLFRARAKLSLGLDEAEEFCLQEPKKDDQEPDAEQQILVLAMMDLVCGNFPSQKRLKTER